MFYRYPVLAVRPKNRKIKHLLRMEWLNCQIFIFILILNGARTVGVGVGVEVVSRFRRFQKAKPVSHADAVSLPLKSTASLYSLQNGWGKGENGRPMAIRKR